MTDPTVAGRRTVKEASAEDALVHLLVDARRAGKPIERLPDDLVPPDEAAAYRVAARVTEAEGYAVGAWKIGATSFDNLRDLGAAQPIYGRVAADAIRHSRCRLPFDDLMTPVDECEFAFVLADDLPARRDSWTTDDVAARVATLHPAIEVGERRISRQHPVPILALIADASAAGHLILGAPVPNWRSHDLAAATVTFSVDGVQQRRGSGREVLGHPLNALAWLANRRVADGNPLRAGEIVTTGSCTGMMPITKGTTHVADFGVLGRVEVAFP